MTLKNGDLEANRSFDAHLVGLQGHLSACVLRGGEESEPVLGSTNDWLSLGMKYSLLMCIELEPILANV